MVTGAAQNEIAVRGAVFQTHSWRAVVARAAVGKSIERKIKADFEHFLSRGVYVEGTESGYAEVK